MLPEDTDMGPVGRNRVLTNLLIMLIIATVAGSAFVAEASEDHKMVRRRTFGDSNTGGLPSSLSAPPPSLVCFSSASFRCPPTPAEFIAPLGSTLTVYIVIQDSQSFNWFNIWFHYDSNALNATSVSLVGSVLPGATVQFECVNGKGSPSCAYWLGNGPGIVALAVNGTTTTPPTTGLLFSVTFKVVGTAVDSSMSFFCTTTPSGPWLLDCAAVFNGSTRVSENVQGATFTTGSGPNADPPAGGGGKALPE